MGGILSRVSSRTGTSVSTKTNAPTPKTPVSPTTSLTQQTIETRRTKWEEALSKMSGTISSKVDEEVKQYASDPTLEYQRHPAQRRKEVVDRLPGKSIIDRPISRPQGHLTQTDILHIYDLLRKDINNPKTNRIAKDYAVLQEDIENLFKYTRTYTGNLDSDGTVRGYFKIGKDYTVERFGKQPPVTKTEANGRH